MNDNYHFESQTVRWAVIVLSVSLLLVYVVLYYVKGDLWKKDLNTSQNTGDIVIKEIENGYPPENYSTGIEMETNTGINNLVGNQNITGTTQSSYIGINTTGTSVTGTVLQDDDIENMIILSGTKTYYGELDFVDKMGISYSYVLIDQKGIYYLNMGGHKYDFSDIARKLKGNLYVMNTDQELIANSLFGDKITFINIPEYKNKKVLFLLDINNQSWLLAIDYKIYHQVKPYLKSLFIY
ncbi:MAG TPA: hypothetical protein PK674_01685 [Candidatus Absconditabacterales bacterium]|nr:hypothetical protein [Candidatus Absconditabacterales bacterium]HPK28100.1 hypothetical protein [Candidatus Absconditabacterales bacterium]